MLYKYNKILMAYHNVRHWYINRLSDWHKYEGTLFDPASLDASIAYSGGFIPTSGQLVYDDLWEGA